MTWSVLGDDADQMLQENALYNLSRKVRNGEFIDFFMSHSWHDNPDSKWAALCKVVEEFKEKHSRSPTFWLDKTCIDQQRISDCLRSLPVSIMASRRMLVF